ncbi:hypothetical protein PR202_gb06732 [Eleusine coracana subsp. coracana]|uniref:RING-type E3 ubiquitin transferase n=1 Tax=Eleusine coracana subsp. coracana TaxID=191504 RepID=A0AAV5E7V8_ELECO|nr:hypothetical protein PR202_gb06732 [Eleusine coracana subsp. coracana]
MELAFATTVCIGGTALLFHLVVEVARRRSGTTALIGLSAMLFFWILTSVLVLPCFCAELVPWSAIKRCLRGARGGDDGTSATGSGSLPQFIDLNVLPREPPVHGRAPVAHHIPAYEQRDAARLDDGASVCAVCLGEVRKEEMVKAAARVPPHVTCSTGRCIDPWLHDHSTCPV